MSDLKKLYEDYNNKTERVDDSLWALAETYNIPVNIIERHLKEQDEARDAWSDYWKALCEPFYIRLWKKLTRR